MEFLGYLIYGVISGFTEFLPVSTSASDYLICCLAGREQLPALLLFTVHLGCFAAVLLRCGKRLLYIYRQMKIAAVPPRRRKRHPDMIAVMDGRLLRLAIFPMIAEMIVLFVFRSRVQSLPTVVISLVLTGTAIYLPQFVYGGNREGKELSPLDAFAGGLAAGLSLFPGMSRTAAVLSAGQLRGCERKYIYDMLLMLSVPAMLVLLIADLVFLCAGGFAEITLITAAAAVLAGLLSFASAFAAATLMKYLAVKAGFSGFAFLSWGAAMFAFILYLII